MKTTAKIQKIALPMVPRTPAARTGSAPASRCIWWISMVRPYPPNGPFTPPADDPTDVGDTIPDIRLGPGRSPPFTGPPSGPGTIPPCADLSSRSSCSSP